MKAKLIVYFLISIFLTYPSVSLSQVQYVDVPDTTLSYTTDSIYFIHIDLNSDGAMDLYFRSNKWTQWMSPSNPNYVCKVMQVFGENNNVVFATATGPLCPTLLNSGDSINLNMNWNTNADIYVSVPIIGVLQCGIPYYDKYYAFKFSNSGQEFLGWIRVDDNGDLTIKDYAYNLIPNTVILAGQTASSVSEPEQKQVLQAYFDPYFNQIIVIKPNLSLYSDVTVVDGLGREVLKQSINGTRTTINANPFKKGVYFLKISGVGLTPTLQKLLIQ